MVDARNLGQLLRWWEWIKPDDVAVADERVTLTWQEFAARTGGIADAMSAHGVRKGDRVAILASNRVEWCETLIAALRIGAVALPLNTRLAPSELRAIVSKAAPKLAFVESATAKSLADALAEVVPDHIVNFDSTAWVEFFEHGEFSEPEVDGEDTAILAFTSGTTGVAKGIELSHRAVIGVVDTHILSEPRFPVDHRQLQLMPLYFFGGLVPSYLASLAVGGSVFLRSSFQPADALKTLVNERISCLTIVPTMMLEIAELPEFADADLSSLVYGSTGATPVPPAVMRLWHRKGVVFRQGYGMTEAGLIAEQTADRAIEHPERVGRPIGHTRVRIVNAENGECPTGVPGEILVKGPSLLTRYFGAETSPFEEGGWFRTGDIGVFHDDGTMSVIDRVKDLIISGGINVYPAEIEKVITELEGVIEVAVVGVPHPRWQEVPHAVVWATPDVTVDDILNTCRANLAKYKVPHSVQFVNESLPRTASGKVLKRLIAEEARHSVQQ